MTLLSAQLVLKDTTAKPEGSLQSLVPVMKVSTAQVASQSLEMMRINALLVITALKDHLKRLYAKLVHINTNTMQKFASSAQQDTSAGKV
jgi:hypothetical protein